MPLKPDTAALAEQRAWAAEAKVTKLKDRLSMLSTAHKLTEDAEIARLRHALWEIIEEFRSGSGGYNEDDTVVIIARAALAPQPPYDDIPGAGQPTCG